MNYPNSSDDEIYQEFSDVDFTHWPFVYSLSARREMSRLASNNHLRFLFNLGGGRFIGSDDFNCQITTNDDVYDFNCLREALKRKKMKNDD